MTIIKLKRRALTGLLALSTGAGIGSLASVTLAQADAPQGHASKRATHRAHHKPRHSKPRHSGGSSGGIPQNGGGDGDSDNHGGPSDGDGNL